MKGMHWAKKNPTKFCSGFALPKLGKHTHQATDTKMHVHFWYVQLAQQPQSPLLALNQPLLPSAFLHN